MKPTFLLFRQYVLGLLITCTMCFSNHLWSQENTAYQEPPAVIKQLIDAPSSPLVSMGPNGKWILMRTMATMPSIEEVAQEELRIGGLRINPQTNGPSRDFSYAKSLMLMDLESKEEFVIEGLPDKAHIGNVSWAPGGEKIAFTHTTLDKLELWALDIASKSVMKLTEKPINAAMRGMPYSWVGANTILARIIPEERSDKPQKPVAPSGPTISSNEGTVAPNRTYQDLLKNPFDEKLFSYYTQSQLLKIKLGEGESTIGKAGIFSSVMASPNGQYIFVQKIEGPFSYLVPYYRFPLSMEIWDVNGKQVKALAKIPAAEDIPKGFGAVRTGPRNFTWRADQGASLYWVEAQDEGDPKNKVEFRDKLFSLEAPFNGQARDEIGFELRYAGITWGNDDLAISSEYWWSDRTYKVSQFIPGQGKKDILYEGSTEDRYNDPGDFVTQVNDQGKRVLLMDKKGKKLFLTGQGASPEGNRPFVDSYDLQKKQSKRLWRSEAPYYEYPMRIVDADKGVVMTRRESVKETPNYFFRDLKSGELTALTTFEHPYPSMKDVKKEQLTYTRSDGVSLSGNLYLPPGYSIENGPLPVLMWAYPREYKNAALAGQMSSSPYRFVRVYYGSPIFWALRGYAVLDNASMPIVGENEDEPNDSFVEQLVENAKAAINTLVEKGVADPKRVAIGGHSYGAFMTANLLAHSDLFAAGIARSGAYNRSLTPFGFQREERTFWEAPEIYFRMSPFMHADKVNEPILLIHGEADNNSGTYPMQSQRYYNALKGHGATTRLVMLPHESHGYRARESIMHMLWEMDQWLEKHVGQKQ